MDNASQLGKIPHFAMIYILMHVMSTWKKKILTNNQPTWDLRQMWQELDFEGPLRYLPKIMA